MICEGVSENWYCTNEAHVAIIHEHPTLPPLILAAACYRCMDLVFENVKEDADTRRMILFNPPEA